MAGQGSVDVKPLACPSSQPDSPGAQVIGVVDWEEGTPRVGYVNGQVPVSEDLLARAGALDPASVFRFGATCASKDCMHFEGGDCQLAKRILDGLTPVVDHLPPCAIRKTCRWYSQEGAEMCLRCPQVVTTLKSGDPERERISGVSKPAG